MIDIHLHFLPAVDDGAENLEQAVAMCRMAAEAGCVALVATPHQRRDEWETGDPKRLRDAVDSLQWEVGAEPKLLLGGEIRVDSELVSDLRSPGHAGILPLAGSKYLLLEFEPLGIGPDPVDLVEALVAEGWRPIVAHPEVTPFLTEDPEILVRMAAAGALLQVTASSLTGDFGRLPRQHALALVEAGLVHFVASDAHRPDWRPPGLERAHEEIAKRFGLATAQRLTFANPLAVLEDRPIAQDFMAERT